MLKLKTKREIDHRTIKRRVERTVMVPETYTGSKHTREHPYTLRRYTPHGFRLIGIHFLMLPY